MQSKYYTQPPGLAALEAALVRAVADRHINMKFSPAARAQIPTSDSQLIFRHGRLAGILAPRSIRKYSHPSSEKVRNDKPC